ncbi:hypothetical protein [Spiroplasma gladiatoris]|nr:hypothetical protein [Spiroplasma gladiatoris]
MYKISIRSFYTYIFMFLIPILLELFIYFYLFKKNIISDRVIVTGPLIFLVIVVNSLFVTNIVSTWRETIFIKQIKNFGINNLTFLVSLFIVYLTYSLVSLIVISCILLGIDTTSYDKKVINLFKTMFSQPSVLIIFIGIILNIILIFCISILIAGFFRNVYLINSLFALTLLYIIITGDYLIDYSFTQSFVYQVFSYLNPQKYINWIFYISYTNSFNGSAELYKILDNVDNYFSFKNIYGPLFSSLFIIPIGAVLTYMSFNISVKK